MADMPENSEELSVLKSTINKPIDKLETFPAPKNVTEVKFFTDELTSIFPITGQPDFGELTIEFDTLKPKWVRVTNEQSKRGGIETTAIGYVEE